MLFTLQEMNAETRDDQTRPPSAAVAVAAAQGNPEQNHFKRQDLCKFESWK